MKILSILIASLFSINSIAQSFEGSISFDVLNGNSGEKGTMIWHTKNNKHRIDYNTELEGQTLNYSLFLFDESTDVFLLTENNGQKFLTKLDLNEIENKYKGLEEARMEKTNEKTIFQGYESKKLTFKSPYFRANCWVSNHQDFKDLRMPKTLSKTGMNFLLSKNNVNEFPLEILAKDDEGNVLFMQSVFKIEKKSVADDVFNFNNYNQAQPELDVDFE